MRWERGDLTVGAVVVATGVIVAATVLWLSPALADRSYPLYAEFGRIDGIAEQGAVRLAGFEVGRVEAIEPRLAPDGSVRFRVRLGIRSRLASGDSILLPEGTRAVLVPPPAPIVPGAIVLRPPPADAAGPPLSPGATLPAEREVALLDDVRATSDELAAELAQTTGAARALLDSLSRTAGAANAMLVLTATELPPMLRSVRTELALVDSLTREVRGQLGLLMPEAIASIDTAQLLLTDSRRLIGEIDGVIRTREPQIGTILANLDTTTVLLTHFVRQVSDGPWRMLTGVDPPRGYEPTDDRDDDRDDDADDGDDDDDADDAARPAADTTGAGPP